MLFDNAVEKVQDYLDAMRGADTIPEFECFDVGIVRCVNMYRADRDGMPVRSNIIS